jgi:CheY-like chemotaxis protein
MRILIVDDSRFFRLANERALTKVGHEVVCAGDGEEGLRLARENPPDLIVLDMMLPILSGPSVLRELRKDLQTVSIPVMVLTSLPKANEGKLLRDGATAYFEKSGLMLDKGSGVLVEEVQRMLSQAGACHA